MTSTMNASVNITDVPDVNESTHWNATEIARLVQLIVRPILVLFGTVGNIMTFYIMRRGSLGDLSTCLYMSVLALADTGKFSLLSIDTVDVKDCRDSALLGTIGSCLFQQR